MNLFGTVLTWTNNDNYKSRVLVRCSVLHINKIPRSVIVCKPGLVGAAGQSWSVPVFVMNSQHNDQLPADEDLVPQDGNPHPLPGQQQNLQHDFWDNVQDLQEIEQANIVEGWQQPEFIPNAVAAAANLNKGWEQWPQQEGELVDQNELNQVIAQANAVVEQAMLQHPVSPQVSDSVSSEAGFLQSSRSSSNFGTPLGEQLY